MMATEATRSEENESRNLLLIGMATSLVIHLALGFAWFSAVVVVARHLATVNQFKALPLEELRKNFQEQNREEPPLMFVEVTPEQAAKEPPKDAKYYSALDSKAANQDPDKETNIPRIQGQQDKVVKTFDTLNPQTQPAQPAPPPEPKQEPKLEPKPEPTPQRNAPQDETRPEPSRKPGDLAFAKPVPEPKPQENQPKPRPRTVIEAKMRQGIIEGDKMKQEGGIKNRGPVRLDVKGTTFGAYDEAFIAAIQRRWYDILEESNLPFRTGKVVIEFVLHADGRITEVRVDEQDVGDILAVYCRRAISDPAPFASWPSDMRRQVGKEYREIKFSFFYQ